MKKPINKKVAAGGFAGGMSLLVVWGLGSLGVDVPPEVAAALTTVITFAVSYLVPDNSPGNYFPPTQS